MWQNDLHAYGNVQQDDKLLLQSIYYLHALGRNIFRFFTKLCVHARTRACVHVSVMSWKAEASGAPRAGVSGDGELPAVGAEN